MNGTWVNVDQCFGDPAMRLVVYARSRVGQELRELLASHSVLPNCEKFDTLLAESLTKFIEERRPDLRGLALFSVSFAAHRMTYEFVVIHPKLPRQSPMSELPAERLETCWTCGKPLGVGEKFQMFVRGLVDPNVGVVTQVVEVCSEECVTAGKMRPYRDPFSGKYVRLAGDEGAGGVFANQTTMSKDDYCGTASPQAKAVVGPVVDSLIANGVLPAAPFSIDQPNIDEVGPTEFEKAWERVANSLRLE